MDLTERIFELAQSGYFCGQILARLLLETIGRENTELVKAMGGLNGGAGYSSGLCGCMTGGCCLISYFTGKGEDTSFDDPQHKAALSEFTSWFKDEMTLDYGGTDCADITKGDPSNQVTICPQVIADTYVKCMEILSERGILSDF